MGGDRLPLPAAIFRHPGAAGGRAHQQYLAIVTDRQPVPIHQVIAMLMRQAAAPGGEVLAPSVVRVTASEPCGGIRLLSASAGTNQAISPSRECTAVTKPKFDTGAAGFTSVHSAPLSTLRQVPL